MKEILLKPKSRARIDEYDDQALEFDSRKGIALWLTSSLIAERLVHLNKTYFTIL